MDRPMLQDAGPQTYGVAAAHLPRTDDAEAHLDAWLQLLERLFDGKAGPTAVRVGSGRARLLEPARRNGQAPAFTLWFRHSGVLRNLLIGRDPLRFAEAYFRGDLDIEGDLFAALELRDHLDGMTLPLADRLALLWRTLRMSASDDTPAAGMVRHARVPVEHTKRDNQEAIAFHYDVSNEFYRLWLDEAMVYSCAYFDRPGCTLEQAQFAKLDLICRKLRLQPGEQMLDIGCGWGALVLHAAQHYGVQAYGVTLSERQYELATERVRAAGLQQRITIEKRDYRDIDGADRFDKISSVGMFEHVGLKNLPTYFATVHRLLKPGGLFMNHGITHDGEGWGKALSSRFINRYVFPDGQLDTISNIQRLMELAHFEIADVEGLRPHYALTLREWVQRLEQRHDEALQYVNEATYRIWRLYMAGSAMEFESAELGLYQILAAKRARVPARLPLTRHYMLGVDGPT